MEKCTQKDVCDCYALPKQTVNNIVRGLKNNGLITLEPGITNRKERFLILTDAGKSYSKKFMDPLLQQELEAVAAMGTERLADTIKLLNEYTEKIHQAMNSRELES